VLRALCGEQPALACGITRFAEGFELGGYWQLPILGMINAEKRWSAAGSEGTNGLPFLANGLPFLTNGDPRTPTRFSGPGFEGSVKHNAELKYQEAGTPIPLATGVEARLIEAEAALQANNRSQFFAIHNALRATIGLPALSDTGQTTAQLVDLNFREGGYWLWLTSHRLGDHRSARPSCDRAASRSNVPGLRRIPMGEPMREVRRRWTFESQSVRWDARCRFPSR
jgi:hypothetical protein